MAKTLTSEKINSWEHRAERTVLLWAVDQHADGLVPKSYRLQLVSELVMRSLGYSIAASWVEEPEKEIALRKGLGKKPWNQLSPAQAGVSWAGLLWGGGWTQMLREDWKKEVVRRTIGSASALFWQQGATCTSGRSQTITTELQEVPSSPFFP